MNSAVVPQRRRGDRERAPRKWDHCRRAGASNNCSRTRDASFTLSPRGCASGTVDLGGDVEVVISTRGGLFTGTPPDNIRERDWLTVQMSVTDA